MTLSQFYLASKHTRAQAMLLRLTITLALLRASSALDPNCAPGGNFDLSKWKLQLPIGSAGSPTTISSSQLQGCDGFQNSYFFTEKRTGALVMTVPGSPDSSGCVTTPGSKHCRTELRESSPSSWSPNATANRLYATLAVVKPDNSKKGTVIGQILGAIGPVCELYYSSKGQIVMGVGNSQEGGQKAYDIDDIPVGQKFSYVISFEKKVLSVSINGKDPHILPTDDLNTSSGYFKAGNYNQGLSQSEVHFFSIKASH